jgi:hypothetical protein
MQPETFNPNIAHIRDGEAAFQVLNEDGTDWDEAATSAAYEAWKTEQPGG